MYVCIVHIIYISKNALVGCRRAQYSALKSRKHLNGSKMQQTAPIQKYHCQTLQDFVIVALNIFFYF